MPVALTCMSHSPLLEFGQPPAGVRQGVDQAFDRARQFVSDFDPELVVSFAPDHYNGFFHELMPPFCVGYRASAIGDFNTAAGELNVASERAEELAQAVVDDDIDMAISRQMVLDHGAVQPLEILFGGLDTPPVIPVFVNGVAQPFTRMRRIRLMGEAVGRYVGNLDMRVLVVGSGGLSHDPPVPQWATADEQQRDLLLAGRNPTPEARAARQQRVIDTAKEFAAGTATIQDLNPEWDRDFMAVCAGGDLSAADSYRPDAMTRDAGNSSHEVRTWLAAFSALSTSGPYEVTSSYYQPIPEYIAGFGVMTAISRDS